MNARLSADGVVSRIASAIGEPARERMLYQLIDDRARTSTELAAIADVSPSTASVHLSRLLTERLVAVERQGKHRYYRLQGPEVAAVLESLSVLAGSSRPEFVASTPNRLRYARTCYDHLAGTLGVTIHDRFRELGWFEKSGESYDVTTQGEKALECLGLDINLLRQMRRRFAFACLDWSDRRAHLGGALGAALLNLALRRHWVERELDSRALSVTRVGRRELHDRFGLTMSDREHRRSIAGRS